MSIMIGADPELFAFDKSTEKYVSAFDLIPGTKDKPFLVNKGAIQVDGNALEFNIEPCSTFQEFKTNISTVMGELTKHVNDKNSNLVLHMEPYAVFEEDYFNSLPDKTKELGCDPDYNAWKEGLVENVVDPKAAGYKWRTASGHIHIGWIDPKVTKINPKDPNHIQDCKAVVRALDRTLGTLSCIWEGSLGRKRKALYGQAGAFRPKPYGVEYRVLSCVWLRDDFLQELVYNVCYRVVNLLYETGEDFSNRLSFNCINFINNFRYDTITGSNFAIFMSLLKEYGILTEEEYIQLSYYIKTKRFWSSSADDDSPAFTVSTTSTNWR